MIDPRRKNREGWGGRGTRLRELRSDPNARLVAHRLADVVRGKYPVAIRACMDPSVRERRDIRANAADAEILPVVAPSEDQESSFIRCIVDPGQSDEPSARPLRQ